MATVVAQSKTLKAKGHSRRKKNNAWLLPEGWSHFLKADSPACAPKRHRQVSREAHRSTQPMMRGAHPHKSYGWHDGLLVRRRRTAARGANRCTSSSPLRTTAQALSRGPGPTIHPLWAPISGCREVEPPLAPVPCLLGAATEDREGEFSKPNAAVSRYPAHGPVKPSSAKTTGQSAARTGVAVDATDGRLMARAHRVNAARAEEAPQLPVMPT
jgi:hypothetical protein